MAVAVAIKFDGLYQISLSVKEILFLTTNDDGRHLNNNISPKVSNFRNFFLSLYKIRKS